MELIGFFIDRPLIGVPLYLAIAFGIWYLIYGLTYRMNGGMRSVFQGFWEELQWHLPGGLALRTDYIRKMVGPAEKHWGGSIGKYSYEEIRDQNLYEKVAKTALGSSFVFWLTLAMHVLWPVGIIAIIAIIILGWVVEIFLFLTSGFRKDRRYS